MIKLMLIASMLINALGVFIFLFILWKRLMNDFAAEMIFKLGFSGLFGIFVGLTISLQFLPDYFLWLDFFGGILGVLLTFFKFRSKFYEIFEAYIIACLPWVGLIFLFDSVKHSSLSSFLGFVAMLIFIFISYYMSSHYKNFNWYKSGKIGFTGLTTLGLIFITRFMLAIFGINMLSFVNKFEAIMSLTGATLCLIILFNLSKSKE